LRLRLKEGSEGADAVNNVVKLGIPFIPLQAQQEIVFVLLQGSARLLDLAKQAVEVAIEQEAGMALLKSRIALNFVFSDKFH
jgi:hypothetical protein